MTDQPKAVLPNTDDPFCPHCGVQFQRKRRNQQYCDRQCQKASSRNSSRGSRTFENTCRTRDHQETAAWLCYDLNRMPPCQRPAHLSKLIISARSDSAKLRNILTDPRLLSADRALPIGKLYPDSRNAEVLNIAKAANAYCRERWGISIKTAMGKDCPVALEVEAVKEPQGPVKETYWQRERREGRLGRRHG